MEENLLGMPLIQRRDYISALKKGNPINQIFIFSGEGTPKEQKVDVYMVNIEVPIYRLKNIRTKSPQLTYIAKNSLNQGFFSNDPEDRQALRAQHELLLTIADSKDDKSHLKAFRERDYDKQNPMMMTSEGVLVNGNTRMSAIRHLYNQNKVDYRRYESVPIAILPHDFGERDFRALELHLQINPDIKKDYSWISEALDCKERISEGYSLDELTEAYGRTKKDIGYPKNLLDQIITADLFLSKLGKVNDYDSLEKDQWALQAWAEWRNAHSNDEIKKRLIDIECFQIIKSKSELSEKGIKGDLYKNIKSKISEFKKDPLLWEVYSQQFVRDVSVVRTQSNDVTNEIPETKGNGQSGENTQNIESSSNVASSSDKDKETENIQTNDNLSDTASIDEKQLDNNLTNETLDHTIPGINNDDNSVENSNEEYSWMDNFTEVDLKAAGDGKLENDEILEALKRVEQENLNVIATMENVISTRKEEFKRSIDKNLIFNEAVEIKANVTDCISRLKNSANDFEKLTEAMNELLEARNEIEELIKLIQTKL